MKNVYQLGFTKTANEIYLSNIRVEGKIPDWLHGTLIRNGPGTFLVGKETYRHWFDGLAMLHRFTIRHGKVSYANKFLACEAYNTARETGKISYSEFATDPCRTLFGKLTAVFNQKITDSAKVNVMQYAGTTVALGETHTQVIFDPETLEKIDYYTFEPKYNQHTTTVHPQFDHAHNTVYNLVTRFSMISHYRMIRLDEYGGSQLVGEIPVKEPAYIHSFGLSPNYLILVEFPLVVYPLKLLLQLKPYIENFQWKPERGATFYVMDRNTGEVVKKLKTDPFFAFHHVNAFEKGNELIVDLDAYDDAAVIDAFYLSRLRDQTNEIPSGRLMRYRINMEKDSIVSVPLSDECIELARFDYERLNMDGTYRYVYGVGIQKESRQGFYNQIVKIDIHTGKSIAWHAPHCYPGEPVFVRQEGKKAEDDGVILSVVLDAEKGYSFLLVLDARNFQEIARAVVPHAVLFGYHGAFFGEEADQ